ncbi:type VI secretion system baseplate subunit TssF [Pseudomonas guariconensis]|uniref:type VI secretion system baseplate subunit TssF n=1 Tax=Pseudomonas TaxID=286 RepID=UPI0020979062|nr:MULTISPECIES: type VI secretion system baseplate subunit TssF [Pseudomonas]MCO7637536.1 type VI secretion system baseplate subunit TssF [Pseudomonas sp. S 311-6]MCO7513950.1 type VI secretion system baseplate subunit TssF [Pseudomonas putida]MCO7563960.1 type VI secretion system baseplate subunit TssF [Pseudomonas mosselii]MCO7604986.1 type VI secretion system baseplate subunit TssF [Pseudomonas guariconensis]MCO7615541.1 type VI secretion system baseplate subunit TssF [Pseudomonas guaricon
MSMDNLTLRYFDAEMRYLREAGKEFAEAFPDRAAHLNLDKAGARDPYVERLFEGFAFLMGRLREKLDDDLPELTEGLVSLLWPHYLRTIPSLSVVELAPDIRQMKRCETLSKGFEVLSQPIGPKRTRCRYTTTQDVTLNPMTIESACVTNEPDGRSVLRLHFACSPLADWSLIDLSCVPLYLNADGPLACALHRALTLDAQALYVRVPGQTDRLKLDGHFSPKGFGDDDRLWPKGDSAFSGYQLLLEYFTFREKFMFVTLHGLERMPIPPTLSGFELDVVLSEQWPHECVVTAEHVRLHAVPVINLFVLEADPLTLLPLQTDYLLRPMRLQDGHTEIYSVDSVSSSKHTTKRDYVPFTSFRHKGGMLRDEAPERYFHTRMKRGANGMHDTWLILGGEGFDADRLSKTESLSLRLTGTNGQLPRKALQSTLLDSLVQSPLAGLKVRNLCAPTLPCYPPNQDRFHWRVLSHLGSNFLPMLDSAEVLRGTLALYDWTHSELNRRRLAAIVEVRHHLIQRFEKGFLLRGVDIEVTLDANGFSGEGDISLFGEMLNRFFALYADIHLFNQLTLILQPTGKCLRWNENHSLRIPG